MKYYACYKIISIYLLTIEIHHVVNEWYSQKEFFTITPTNTQSSVRYNNIDITKKISTNIDFFKHIEGILKNIDINKNVVSLSHGIPLEWARVQYNKKPGSPFSEAMFSLEGIGNCISHNSGGWAGGGTPYSRVNVHWFENLGVDGMILFLQILFYNTYCAASDFQNR